MLNELKKLVIAQKTAVLSPEAPTPNLEALHAALVRYDQVVSQAVIQTIQGAEFDFPKQQVAILQTELERLFIDAGDSSREVDIYRKYKQRLDQMIDLAEQASQNQI